MQIYWSNSVLILSLCGFFKPQGGSFRFVRVRKCSSKLFQFLQTLFKLHLHFNISFILYLNTKILLFSLRKISPTYYCQLPFMQVPWIDISKELCQLERENRLIAGYSHTRNSSEVFLVHNGHTIYSPNCFKTMPGMTWFNILRCFLEKISEKNHAQHTEKNDDTSHFKSLGTSRSFFSNNIFNCFAFKLYDTGIVSSSAIALLYFFSFKNNNYG